MLPSIGHGLGPGGRGNSGRRSNALWIKKSASTAAAAPKRTLGGNIAVIILAELRKAL